MQPESVGAATWPARPGAGWSTLHRLCVAQLVSRVGSELTAFALGVWFFRATGLVSAGSLLVAAAYLPPLLVAPLAGAVVDRVDRGRVLRWGHTAAGALTLVMALCVGAGAGSLGLVTALVAAVSARRAGEMAAVSALTAQLIEPAERGRANGLVQLGYAVSQLAAPVLGAGLLDLVGVRGVLLVDVASFAIAVGLLSTARTPSSPGPIDARDHAPRDPVSGGWRHLRASAGLGWLALFLAALRGSGGLLLVLVTPLVLGFSDVHGLALVRAAGGVGFLAGGLWVATRGVPRRRVRTVLIGAALQGGLLMLLGARKSLPLAVVACAGLLFLVPIMSVSNELVWQRRVPPALLGRVLSIRNAIAGCAVPLALIVAGPLADLVFEPAMAPGAPLARALPFLGAGAGRGAGLLLIGAGAATLGIAALARLRPSLRHLDDEAASLSLSGPPVAPPSQGR